MKIETTQVRTVTLTDTDIRIALCQYANLPAGSVVKYSVRTDGEVVGATVAHSKVLSDGDHTS